VIEVSSSKGTDTLGAFSSHLRMETDPLPKTLCLLVFRIPDDDHSQETQ
jgi:hypothetical protein